MVITIHPHRSQQPLLFVASSTVANQKRKRASRGVLCTKGDDDDYILVLFPGYHVLFRISHIHRGMVQTPMKISYSGRDTLWRFINCSSPSLSTLFKFITHPLTTTWKESDTLEIILSHPRRLTISLMFSWHFLLSCSTFEKHPTPTHQQSLPLQSSPTLAKSYGGAIWFPLFFFPIGGHPSPFHSQKLFYPLHPHRMAECPMSGRY